MTHAFFLSRSRFARFLHEWLPLRAFYYGPEGTGVKGDHGAWDPPLDSAETGWEPYEGWNGRKTDMNVEQEWHHNISFDPFTVEQVHGHLCVGRPGGTRGLCTYLWFKITKKLLDLLHLESVLPVMEAPVKDRAGGGPWLRVLPVLGDDTRIMVFWLVPS